MRIYDARGKVEEVSKSNRRQLVSSKKEERWTYIYMVIVAVLFWTLCYVVLR